MKKYLVILTVLALVLGMGIAVYASDDPNYTDNLNLWKPSADDRTAALPDVNANWDTLDSILGGDTDIEMLSIGGDITAVGSGSTGGGIHTRPLTINRTRTTVQLNADSSDTGAFIRIQNSANQPTGYWLTGLDCEARVTGSGSETTNLYGANITAHGHITSSGGVVNAYGLKVESKMNAQITGNNKGLYVRMFRQSFNHPSTEYGIYLENANDAETGSGLDAGIYLESTGSNATDNPFVYGIDLSAATVTTADLRLSDSSQISATTNGATLGSATNATLINYVGAGNRLIVTFADYAMVITDHAGNGGHGSLKLITFPVGMIDINGIVGDIAITAGAGFANDAEFDMALGSITTGIDNDILAGAEQDVVDKVDGELDGSFADTIDLVNVTLQQEDGHSGATDVWFNVAVLDTDMSTTGSITMSGTIVITWTNLGDY